MAEQAVAQGQHPFSNVQEPVLESLNQLQADFAKDDRKTKVDLMVGSYQPETGGPHVLPSVKQAKEKIAQDPNWNHEYPSSHLGEAAFRNASMRMIFGADSLLLASSRVASMQALGASGACHMGALFLKRHYWPSESPTVYMAQDSWANHPNVFTSVGLEIGELPYYNQTTRLLDFDALLETAKQLPRRSIILLQVCGNNPTGCDLDDAQWTELAAVLKSRDIYAFLDLAYQGFVSGDAERDSSGIRILVDHDIPLLVAATYGKAFGLYGERVGHLCITTPDAKATAIVEKQMKLQARAETGAQPRFGALIVSTILEDARLFSQWKRDVAAMAASLRERRGLLRTALESQSGKDWSFVTKQKGMFLFTGLSKEQTARLKDKYAVYLQDTGRLSIAALTPSNIAWVAHSLVSVTAEQNLC